jgi:hypothetical protein
VANLQWIDKEIIMKAVSAPPVGFIPSSAIDVQYDELGGTVKGLWIDGVIYIQEVIINE